MKTNSETKSNSEGCPNRVQITNYKTGIFRFSFLSGYKTGRKRQNST